MKKTGIVLSGGGARGIAHLGVLEALDELGIRIDAMAGTSAGAIAAVLYAAGNKPRMIMELLTENSYFGITRLQFNKAGFFKMDGLKTLLQKHVKAARFEDLPIRLFVAATDLTGGTTRIFESGLLLEPVLASSCVPVIYEPVLFQDREWVDGGVLNNFPVEPLEPLCDLIIGSHVNRLGDPPQGKIALRKMQMMEKCFHLAISANVYGKASKCHLFLDPPELARYALFEVQKAKEIFDIGYRNCMLHQVKLLEMVRR